MSEKYRLYLLNILLLCNFFGIHCKDLNLISREKIGDPAKHFSFLSGEIFSENAEAVVDPDAESTVECAFSCTNKPKCNAFMLTNKKCRLVEYSYEELTMRNGIEDRENGGGIYFSNFRSHFRLLMNVYPILSEQQHPNFTSWTAESCARWCYIYFPGCQSFTYVREKKECLLMTNEFPVETGLIEVPGVDLYELLEESDPLDYFFMTLRQTDMISPWQSNNVSLHGCADKCLRVADWSAFQYDTRRKICSLYSTKYVPFKTETKQGMFFFEKQDDKTFYFSATNGNINVIPKYEIGKPIQTENTTYCADECLTNKVICRGFIQNSEQNTCQLIKNSAFVPEIPKYNPTENLYSMIPLSECPDASSPKVIYTTGELASPGWPWPFYADNISCSWRMASLSGRRFFMKINNMDLVDPTLDDNSNAASLTIGNSKFQTEDDVKQFLVYKEIPESPFDITFYPGNSPVLRQGFSLDYKLMWSCGSKEQPIRLIREGTLANPNYPDLYPDKGGCTWHIVSPDKTKNIILVFKDFLMGSNEDPIGEANCQYANTLLIDNEKHCGKAPTDYTIYTKKNEIDVTFEFLDKQFFGRFKIEFYFGSIPENNKDCNRQVEVDDSPVIVDMSGDTLPKVHEFTCDLYVNSTNSTQSDYGLQIEFLKLGVGYREKFLTCPNGWVRIYNGVDRKVSSLVTELCGTKTPDEIYKTSQSNILISFNLLANLIQIPEEKFGYVINITRYQLEEKNENSTSSKECPEIEDGVVTSLGYPIEDYPYNSNCQWKLSKENCQKLDLVNENLPLNNQLRLRLSFQDFQLATIKPPVTLLGTQFCDMDFLTVKSQKLNREEFLQCGSIREALLKDYLFDFDDSVTVEFSSDDRWNAKGFQLTMEEVVFYDTENNENDVIYDNSLLLSPHWPVTYNLKTDITWPKIVPGNDLGGVHLVFTEVDLGEDSCSHVILEVVELGRNRRVTQFCKRSDLTTDNQNLFVAPIVVKLKLLLKLKPRDVTVRMLVQFRELPTTIPPTTILPTTIPPTTILPTTSETPTTLFIPTESTTEKRIFTTTGEGLIQPTESTFNIIPIIGGAVTGLLLVTLVILGGIVYWRRKRRLEEKENLIEMEPEWEENKLYRPVDDVIREKRVARSVYPSVMYIPESDEVNIQRDEQEYSTINK